MLIAFCYGCYRLAYLLDAGHHSPSRREGMTHLLEGGQIVPLQSYLPYHQSLLLYNSRGATGGGLVKYGKHFGIIDTVFYCKC